MFCFHCKEKFSQIPSNQKCPRCGKTYDESGYLGTGKAHKKWYKIDQGKARNNPKPKKFEKRK